MHSIHFLEHTADVRVQLKGDSFEELLCAGMEVLFRLLHPGACESFEEPEVEEKVDLRSFDRTALLVDFLSEVLTASYTHKAVFCDAEIATQVEENVLRATLKGKKVQYFAEDIKAVTYHEAMVKQGREGKWETIVVLDI
jgi:SHS2 domain-containing protein